MNYTLSPKVILSEQNTDDANKNNNPIPGEDKEEVFT